MHGGRGRVHASLWHVPFEGIVGKEVDAGVGKYAEHGRLQPSAKEGGTPSLVSRADEWQEIRKRGGGKVPVQSLQPSLVSPHVLYGVHEACVVPLLHLHAQQSGQSIKTKCSGLATWEMRGTCTASLALVTSSG